MMLGLGMGTQNILTTERLDDRGAIAACDDADGIARVAQPPSASGTGSRKGWIGGG